MIFCVCEDEQRQLEYLIDLLKKVADGGDHEFISFDTPQKLMNYAQNNHIDVLVMDINLGTDNGIDWVNKIHDFQWLMPVIFVTGDDKRRWNVYDANHVYALRKPVNEDELVKAVGKAINAAAWRDREMKSKCMVVKNRAVQTVVGFHEILYMESEKRKLHIYFKNELIVAGEPLVTYASVKDTMRQLDGRFNQCHKSFIVNMDFIRNLDRQRYVYVLKNGKEIPISQSMARKSIDAFLEYIGGKGRGE
ncbi:LytR/AlgR family response regulator transcription factor [Cohnella cellulosilytica]|uniref:LytR/AlgR family response regulator transcription factor n=1 Tax=Cohnella cellulosilytica TaxID=986710 RepID=A0ABW2F4Y6_9BACL